MMKIKKDDISLTYGEWVGHAIEIPVKDELSDYSKKEAEQLKQQILDNQEKAKKYDEIPDTTLGFIRAFKWLDNETQKIPENIQKMIIRSVYYPTASREEEILVHLLLRNAIKEKSAISIPEDKILHELVEAEHIVKTKIGKFYLSQDGVMIAKGALKLYPELEIIRQNDSDKWIVKHYFITHDFDSGWSCKLGIISSRENVSILWL